MGEGLVLIANRALKLAFLIGRGYVAGEADIAGSRAEKVAESEGAGEFHIARIDQFVGEGLGVFRPLGQDLSYKGAFVDFVVQPEGAEGHAQQAAVADKILGGAHFGDFLGEVVNLTRQLGLPVEDRPLRLLGLRQKAQTQDA